jgi:hypothetical protein
MAENKIYRSSPSTPAKPEQAPPTAMSTGSFAVSDALLPRVGPESTDYSYLLPWTVTVQTGSITAVTAMVDLLVFLLKPVRQIFAIVGGDLTAAVVY